MTIDLGSNFQQFEEKTTMKIQNTDEELEERININQHNIIKFEHRRKGSYSFLFFFQIFTKSDQFDCRLLRRIILLTGDRYWI